MRIIDTATTDPGQFNEQERDWLYNATDCMVTAEVLEALLPQLDNATSATYTFSRELQAPVLEMKLRGVLVDQARKEQVMDELHEKLEILEANLDRIVLEGVGMYSFNWRSNEDLQRLFYHYLQIPEVRKKGRPSADRDALEKIAAYTVAQPIVAHILALKDIGKKIGVLRTAVDPDGRIRTSYNIAGTSTGRFSSSLSEFGTGGNLQNVEESLRSILIADPGYKFAKFDAKSGESFCVGAIEWNLFRDSRYLDACESGDPHTAVARVCWPKLPWTGDLGHDKGIAEQPFYRHYSHRFMCKKLGHGSNYGGKPNTLAQQTKLPIGVVTTFQPIYFSAFPAHELWQDWVREEIRRCGTLTSLTGRKRQFWGRRNDDSTIREAIAYDPQCSLAELVNRAMLKIWRSSRVKLMLQDHDALTFMYPEEEEDEVVPWLLEQLVIPLELEGGRTLRIPYDAQVGFNRGKYDAEKNPFGLRDWSPSNPDQRSRPAQVRIMDRPILRTHRKPARSFAVS